MTWGGAGRVRGGTGVVYMVSRIVCTRQASSILYSILYSILPCTALYGGSMTRIVRIWLRRSRGQIRALTTCLGTESGIVSDSARFSLIVRFRPALLHRGYNSSILLGIWAVVSLADLNTLPGCYPDVDSTLLLVPVHRFMSPGSRITLTIDYVRSGP